MTDTMTGFNNHFATEAVPGALPIGRNSPQKPAFGLYAEQLSGSAFTAPRHENKRSWLYRLRPGLPPRRSRDSRTSPPPKPPATTPPAFLPVHVRPGPPAISAAPWPLYVPMTA